MFSGVDVLVLNSFNGWYGLLTGYQRRTRYEGRHFRGDIAFVCFFFNVRMVSQCDFTALCYGQVFSKMLQVTRSVVRWTSETVACLADALCTRMSSLEKFKCLMAVKAHNCPFLVHTDHDLALIRRVSLHSRDEVVHCDVLLPFGRQPHCLLCAVIAVHHLTVYFAVSNDTDACIHHSGLFE